MHLHRHPSFFTLGAFTHKGPSDEQLAATSFTMTVCVCVCMCVSTTSLMRHVSPCVPTPRGCGLTTHAPLAPRPRYLQFYAKGYSGERVNTSRYSSEPRMHPVGYESPHTHGLTRTHAHTAGENLPSDVESAEQRPLVRPPPDKTLVTRVSGPEPGYVATPLIFVEVGAYVTSLLAWCVPACRPG